MFVFYFAEPVHCIVSEWENWTGCSTKCGFGVRKRKRSIKQKNQNGGNPCGPLEQVRGCNMNSICDSNEDSKFVIRFILKFSMYLLGNC